LKYDKPVLHSAKPILHKNVDFTGFFAFFSLKQRIYFFLYKPVQILSHRFLGRGACRPADVSLASTGTECKNTGKLEFRSFPVFLCAEVRKKITSFAAINKEYKL